MKVFIEKERCDHVRIANDTGADLGQYEFGVVGPFAAVADEIILNGAVGPLHVEQGIQIQAGAADLKDGQNTFATPGKPVYWDATSKKFSDTLTNGYYKVGSLITPKNSDGVILFEKSRYATLVPADEAATSAAAILAVTSLSGIPFKKTATLKSAAAATPVHILTAAEVGAGKKAYVHSMFASVDGATKWATTATVALQDTAASPVAGATIAVAGLTANAQLMIPDTNITLAAPIADGAGFTTAKGLDIVADANGTGSDLIVTIFGYIA